MKKGEPRLRSGPTTVNAPPHRRTHAIHAIHATLPYAALCHPFDSILLLGSGDFKYCIENFGYKNNSERRETAMEELDGAVEKSELYEPYARSFGFVEEGYFEKALHLKRFLLRSGLVHESDLATCNGHGDFVDEYVRTFRGL
jgi:hypothetical protein